MHTKTEEIMFEDDDNAATYVTCIEGWVDKNGEWAECRAHLLTTMNDGYYFGNESQTPDLRRDILRSLGYVFADIQNALKQGNGKDEKEAKSSEL